MKYFIRICDPLTSRGLRDQLFVGFVMVLALIACACTFVHAGEPLNVGAIAGRPASAVSDAPELDVTAIARAIAPGQCRCPGCTCDRPHQCGDPGCTCSLKATQAQPPLNLAAISPKRAAAVVAGSQPVRTLPVLQPSRAPHWELRRTCNGGYCTQQWVWVQ